METSYSSDKEKRIIAGDTIYKLKFIGDKFILSRFFNGRGLDQEWSGKFINQSFEFDEKPKEDLQIYVQESAGQDLAFIVKGKYGCLGNKIKEVELVKKI